MQMLRNATLVVVLLCHAGFLAANDFRLERLSAWGNAGYLYLEEGPTGWVGVTRHGVDFLNIDSSGQPTVTQSVQVTFEPIHRVQRDGSFLWIEDSDYIRLVELGDQSLTDRVRHEMEQNWVHWAGDRTQLVAAETNQIVFYRVKEDGTLESQKVVSWPQAVSALALLDEALALLGRDVVSLLPVDADSFDERLVLADPDSGSFESGGLAVSQNTLYTIDADHHRLVTWRRTGSEWGLAAQLSLGPLERGPRFLQVSNDHLVLGDRYEDIHFLSRGDEGGPQLLGSYTVGKHQDVLLTAEGRWLLGGAAGLQVWGQTDQGAGVLGRLEHGGEAGELAYKDHVLYWVKGDAVWLFDRSNPFALAPLGKLDHSDVRQLRRSGDVLAVLADELHLYDVADPTQPSLQSSLPIFYEAMDLNQGDSVNGPQLAAVLLGGNFGSRIDIFDLSNLAEPQTLVNADTYNYVIGVAFENDALFTLKPDSVAHYVWSAEHRNLALQNSVYSGTGHLEHRQFAVAEQQVFTHWVNGNLAAMEHDAERSLRRTTEQGVIHTGGESEARLTVKDGRVALGGRDLVIMDATQPYELNEIARLESSGVFDTLWLGNLLYVSGGPSGRLEAVRFKPVVSPLYVPWISHSESFQSSLTFVNEGALPQTISLTALLRGEDARSRTLTLSPNQAQRWDADALFPGKTGYSLKVEGDSQTVAVFLERRDPHGSVIQPAQPQSGLGSDLVFPAFRGDRGFRALVVTPLDPNPFNLGASLSWSDNEGRVVGHRRLELELMEPNVVVLPEGDYSYRVHAERDVPLLGEQFQFQTDLRHQSVSPRSFDAIRHRRSPLTSVATVPHNGVIWHTMAAQGNRVALAELDRVVVYRRGDQGISQETVIDGFEDLRDLAWVDDILLVADIEGVHVIQAGGSGEWPRVATVAEADVVQVEAGGFPNRRMVIGTHNGSSSARWKLYDLDHPGEPRFLTMDHYAGDTAFSFDDGLLTLFPQWNHIHVLDLRDATQVQVVEQHFNLVLMNGGFHQLFRVGAQILWLYPNEGLLNMFRPWFVADGPFRFGFSPHFLSGTAAFGDDTALVADRENGLALVDTSSPADLKVVDRRIDLEAHLTAADAGNWWVVTGPDGDLHLMETKTRQPQFHAYAVPDDGAGLQLSVHQGAAVATELSHADGVLALQQQSARFAMASVADAGETVAFESIRPVTGWLHNDDLDWIPTFADDRLAAKLMLPLQAGSTRVTLLQRGETGKVTLSLVLQQGTGTSHAVTLSGGQTTSLDLADAFSTEQLSQAVALRITGAADARLGAMLHLVQEGRETQLVPAFYLR